MEPSTTTLTVAFIALFGTLFNTWKSSQNARETRNNNERLSKELKSIDARQQSELALFQSELGRMSANYSKRVEVLTESYAKLVEIKLLMESFVVPLFEHSVTGDKATIRRAADKFEELYHYSSMNFVYFRKDSTFMSSLGELMGHINHMQNNANSGDKSSWHKQARIVIEGVNPILSNIAAEVRKELKLD